MLRIFAFIFALHILNISVDPLDPNPYWASGSTSVNEMESITEIIFEKILHIENIFHENKHDSNNKGSLLARHLTIICYYQPLAAVTPVIYFRPLYFKHTENFFEQHSADILTPPPKA